MKKLFQLFLGSLLSIIACTEIKATDQISDIIVYQGENYYFSADMDHYYPLYPMLEDTQKYHGNLPKYSTGQLKLSSCNSSGCYRGYIAEWEIFDNVFYLTKVKDCCTGEPLFDLKEVFGEDAVTDKGVKAVWLSSKIGISSKPISSFTWLDPMSSIYLTIEKGNIHTFDIEQTPDAIKYEDEPYYLHADLDQDFLLHEIISDPNYQAKLSTDTGKEFELSACNLLNCHRDYQALWEVHDSTLYLKAVRSCCGNRLVFNLETLFGEEVVSDKGVVATWVNQDIYLSSSSYTRVFDNYTTRYLRLTIDNGIITRVSRY